MGISAVLSPCFSSNVGLRGHQLGQYEKQSSAICVRIRVYAPTSKACACKREQLLLEDVEWEDFRAMELAKQHVEMPQISHFQYLQPLEVVSKKPFISPRKSFRLL